MLAWTEISVLFLKNNIEVSGLRRSSRFTNSAAYAIIKHRRKQHDPSKL